MNLNLFKGIEAIHNSYHQRIQDFKYKKQERLASLEVEYVNAKEIRRKNKRIALIMAAVLSLLVFTFAGVMALFMIPFVCVIVVIMFGITSRNRYEPYLGLLNEICNDYGQSSTFRNVGIYKEVYKESGVYCSFDDFKSFYTLQGENNKYKYLISKIHTEDESTDSDGNTTHSDVFFGLFYKIQLKEYSSDCIIHILENRKLEIFKSSRRNLERVKFEDAEFERFYDVYSNDQIKSRVVLEPRIMSYFNEFAIKADRKVRMALNYDTLFIEVPLERSKRGLLDGKIQAADTNFDDEINSFCSEFYAMTDFIDDVLEMLDI